jgi:penicillin amidase
VRQALELIGAPLTAEDIAASATALPSPWYVVALRSDHIHAAGATWPGVPGDARSISNAADQPANPSPALVKHLLALPPEGWLQFRVHGMLRQWDYDLSGGTRLGNASAAVYQAWIWHLARDTFQDELGPELFTRYWAAGPAPDALVRLSDRHDDAWWDDVTTNQPETRDDVMRRAYAAALLDLGRHYGDLHTIWEWDTMHAAVFRHPLGRALPLTWLNRQVKLGGGAPFDPAHPDEALRPYAATIVPSLRISQDGDGESGFAIAGGQSGHPLSPHYADLFSLWARDEHVPLQDPARPEDLTDVEGILTLTP